MARPEVGLSKPQSMRINVVLPEPLGPSIPKISPSPIERLRLFTAAREPKLLVRFSITIASAIVSPTPCAYYTSLVRRKRKLGRGSPFDTPPTEGHACGRLAR